MKFFFWNIKASEETKNRVIKNIESANSKYYRSQVARAEIGFNIIEDLKNGSDACAQVYREMVEAMGEAEANKQLIKAII